jgi:hypothetical protein
MRLFPLTAAGIGLWGQPTITTVKLAVNRPTAVHVDAAGNIYFRENQY